MASKTTLTSDQLVAKVEPLLQPGELYPREKVALLHQAMRHPSADGSSHHPPLATLGDAILKYRLASYLMKEQGGDLSKFKTAGDLSLPINAAAENASLACIYRDIAGFDPGNIEVGAQYPFAQIERSVRRQATAMEALIAVLEQVLGPDTCQAAVEKLYGPFFSNQNTTFAQFRKYDPISNLEKKVGRHMSGQAQDWIEFNASPKLNEKGEWTATAGIKTAPKQLYKGPLSMRKKSEVKRKLFELLDQDPEVNKFIKQHGRKGKVEGVEAAAVGESATDGDSKKRKEPRE